MKIGILVQSPLLERTLQLYLREYLVANADDCDFVITDKVDESQRKPICLINFSEDSDILRPIHKESLMSDLARFSTKLREMRDSLGDDMDTLGIMGAKNVLDFGELERLKQSVELINGLEPSAPKNAEVAVESTNEKDIKDKIENMVAEYRNRLYDLYGAIKNEK